MKISIASKFIILMHVIKWWLNNLSKCPTITMMTKINFSFIWTIWSSIWNALCWHPEMWLICKWGVHICKPSYGLLPWENLSTLNSPIKAPHPIGRPPLWSQDYLVSGRFRPYLSQKRSDFQPEKKPLEDEITLSLMRAHPKGFPMRPAPLLGNLR